MDYFSVTLIITKVRTHAANITAIDTDIIKHGRQLCKIENTTKISLETTLM
jgi:hypothetical protein